MSWVEKRVTQYQQGQKATWLEKRALEHGHPVHATLALISIPLFIYGLWTHSWLSIALGVTLNFIGHLIVQR